MLTRSGKERAFIFSMTLPRCPLTVISLIPNSPPTCLFNNPETTSAITSRSRGVSSSWRCCNSARSVCCPSAALLRATASEIAAKSIASSMGLVKNSTAPAFIALTVVGMSPFPVMKMMGTCTRSVASRSCSSRPFRSGSPTSSTRQLGARIRGQSKKACAEANVSGCHPAHFTRPSRDSLTDTSSSTINTMGVVDGTGLCRGEVKGEGVECIISPSVKNGPQTRAFRATAMPKHAPLPGGRPVVRVPACCRPARVDNCRATDEERAQPVNAPRIGVDGHPGRHVVFRKRR